MYLEHNYFNTYSTTSISYVQTEYKEWGNLFWKLNKIASNSINNKYAHANITDFYALADIPPFKHFY